VTNVFAFLVVKMDTAKNLWNVDVKKGGKGCFVTNLNVAPVHMDFVVPQEFAPAILVTRESIVKRVFQTQIANMVLAETIHLNVIVMMDLRACSVTNLFARKDATLNMECASNLKNVGAEQVGKEKIVTSVSDLLIVSMVFAMSLSNANVTKVFLVRIVMLQLLSMEIGDNGGLGQNVMWMVANRPETELAMTHPPLEVVGIAPKMEVTHSKNEPVLILLFVMVQV